MTRPQLQALETRPARIPTWHRPTRASLVAALVAWPLICLGGVGVAPLLPGCFVAMKLWGRQAFLPALLGQGVTVALLVSCTLDPKPRRRREQARAQAEAIQRRAAFHLIRSQESERSSPP